MGTQNESPGGWPELLAPLRRLERRHLPPEGSALSTELQGHLIGILPQGGCAGKDTASSQGWFSWTPQVGEGKIRPSGIEGSSARSALGRRMHRANPRSQSATKVSPAPDAQGWGCSPASAIGQLGTVGEVP